MKIQLSDHFDCKRLLRFTLPSILMMIFTSIFGVVDGFFVSNFVGKTPFAAINFVMPVIMILGAFGFMFGAGGSAIIAKTMGEGKDEKAKKLFSFFVCAAAVSGVVVGLLGFIFIRPVCRALGADENMMENCVLYARILFAALPFYMLQYEFQSFFIAAEKPQVGLWVTIAAGVTNMVLDALFTAVFKWGIAGAAVATAISQAVGGIVPFVYFLKPNSSALKFVKPEFDLKALIKACTNGSSELMSNISTSVVGMLYNVQLMKYAGENGIAAYGVLMYVNLIFIAVFIGYSTGIAPIVSYNFGSENHEEMKGLFKKSIVITAIFSVCMFIMGEVLARPLSAVFVSYDKELTDITVNAFKIYSFSFLLAGFSIFGSAFFTALNDGLTSAIISFLRTLVFQIAAVLILPLILGIDGIWYSIIVAEIMSVIITAVFLIVYRNKYKYL